MHLGKYLGPAIDVGPQHNGEVVYWSTYQPLMVKECAKSTIQQDMVTFMEAAEERLGAKLACTKLEEVGIPNTPEYIPYSDEDQNEKMFPDLDEDIMPEVGDQ